MSTEYEDFLFEQNRRLRAELAALQTRFAEVNDFEKSQCTVLLVKLAEKDKQLAAALEDLRVVADCITCKNALRNGGKCWGGCKGLVGSSYTYEWRGPQASGEQPTTPATPPRAAQFERRFAGEG